MAFVPAFLLVLFLFLRPMDLSEAIAKIHSLETLSALTALGVAVELLRRQLQIDTAARTLRGPVRSSLAPQLPWLAGFYAWMYIVTVLHLGASQGLTEAWNVTLGPVFMVLVVFALGTKKRLRAMMVGLIACLGFISVVAIHQGMQPRECVELREDPLEPDVEPLPVPDGRECSSARLCESESGNPGSDYVCERVGVLRTFSTQGRVRWRGQLDDPNEVAVMIGALMPFVFMFARSPTEEEDGPRGPMRALVLALLGVYLVVSLWAVVYTQSRGGQIVLAVGIASILVRRFGWKAIFLGGVLTAPLVALSWRSGADAESSSVERGAILSEGLQLLREHPLIGVGIAQFARENPMNMAAHNSYLLVACEAGVPGFLVWCGLVWTTIKIPFVIATRPPPGLAPGLVRFAEALTASALALHFGVFFLSFVYKTIYFVWIGFSGALFLAVRAEHPGYLIPVTRRDLVGIVALAVGSILAVRLATLGVR